MATSAAATSKRPPSPGDTAPDDILTDTEGQAVTLSDLWGQTPLALVFVRHFGCIFCREQLALLKADYPKFLDAGGQIACVGQGSFKVAKAIKILLDLPFPILTCGEDLSVFGEWGLGRATLIQLLSPSVIVAGFRAMLHGHRQTGVIGDGLQLAGAFVIDTGGQIRYAHRNKNVADHALSSDLLTALKSLERKPE